MEAFLNEPDVLYDVSPLPKDDTPMQKLENIANTPTTVSNVDEISPPNPASYASGVVSREESMYFTPDATTEKLSEISLEWIPNLQNTFIVLIVISNDSMKIQSVIIQIHNRFMDVTPIIRQDGLIWIRSFWRVKKGVFN